MKKTIAILLILVIGMVGVFADPAPVASTADVKIGVTTLIEPINDMLALSSVSVDWDNPTNGIDNTEGGNYRTVSSATETTVGYLHSRSNNRAGYVIKMQAGPLKSTASGVTGGIQSVVYLGYEAKAYLEDEGDLVEDAISTTVTTPSSAGGNVPITSISNLSGLVENYREIKVTVPDFATALAGEYFADITFTYLAN